MLKHRDQLMTLVFFSQKQTFDTKYTLKFKNKQKCWKVGIGIHIINLKITKLYPSAWKNICQNLKNIFLCCRVDL